MSAQVDFEDTMRGMEAELEKGLMEDGMKKEELARVATLLMKREFQHILGALVSMMPGYEELLVRFIMKYFFTINKLVIECTSSNVLKLNFKAINEQK